MVLKESLPFDAGELVEDIRKFMLGLENLLRQEDGEGVYYTLRSFMDLCVRFQPSMKANHDIPVFNMWTYVFLFYMFQNNGASNSCTGFHRRMILQSWSNLCRSYKTLPKTKQASRRIISHYSLKSSFKSELEDLLKALRRHENMFERTIAMSILNMSNHGDFPKLRAFIRAIESFLLEDVGAYTRFSNVVAIWKFVLWGFRPKNVDPSHKSEEKNRLKVLDFAPSMITKFVSSTLRKRELEERIPEYLVNAVLTESERNTLGAFSGILQESEEEF